MGDQTVGHGAEQSAQAAGGGTAGAAPSTVSRAADVCAGATRALEHGVERVGDSTWRMLKHRPFLGVVLAAGAGLGAAVVVGAGELGIGIAAGYAAYQMLRKNLPPSEALRKTLELQKDIP
jgi:hypothetical protein